MKLRTKGRSKQVPLIAIILGLAYSAFAQTAEDHFKSANRKVVETEKLVWNSEKWKAKFRSSLTDINAAITMDPKKAAYFAKRAEIQEHLGDYALALEDASTAISLTPDLPDYYVVRGSLRSQIEAIRVADERTKLDDPNEAAKIVADHSLAHEDYNKAISLAPENPRWYIERGNFFDSQNKQPKLALADLTRALQLQPDNTVAYWQRGLILESEGRSKEALADYSAIIKIEPKRTVAYLARAWIYFELKQYQEAIADATSAIRLAPSNNGPLRARAEMYRKIGKIALARKDELAAKRLAARSSK